MGNPDQQQDSNNISRAFSGLGSPLSTVGISETTRKISELATQYRSSVARFNLHCKLSNGANINGQIKNTKYTDFEGLGPNTELFLTDKEPGFRMISAISENQDDHPALMQSQFVCTTGKKESGHEVASFYFFQDSRQVDSRTHATKGYITFELPDADMQSFLGDIRTYPDLFEQFYQSLYRNLDSKNGEPGLRRIPAGGFYILENDDLNNAGKLSRYDSVAIGNFFQSIKDRTYFRFLDGPYGTGEKPTK